MLSPPPQSHPFPPLQPPALAPLIAAKGITLDDSQQRALAQLQQLLEAWQSYKTLRRSRLRKIIAPPAIPAKGIYLYGECGSGKSLLMDSFFIALPLARKWRTHFYSFMQEVHRELLRFRGEHDPLQKVASSIAKKYRLICFDEFHISDIADAMLLYRLLRALFDNGVGFVMTSNYAPDALYPNGLQRDKLLPAIALIKQKMTVIEVGTGVDYRLRFLRAEPHYFYPLDARSQAEMARLFKAVSGLGTPPLYDDPDIAIGERHLKAVAVRGKVVWFEFAALCRGNRSADDYLFLAKRFDTFFISDVPQMGEGDANPARRFTWLIDVLYQYRARLVMSAAVPATALYRAGHFAHEFVRTVSRLVEMQSEDYWAQAIEDGA